MTLQEQLDAIRVQSRAKRPAEWLVIMDRALDELKRSGLAEHSLKAGDRAPEFALPNGAGQIIRSAERLTPGALVVSFYRGGW
jgi:hypothetical protein